VFCHRDTAAIFRSRLKQLILERYPSLDPFSLESALSKGHVSEILRGVSSPSVATLIKLAAALDVEVNDFFLFPEDSTRHRAIVLLEECSQETVEAALKLLSAQAKKSTKKKAGQERRLTTVNSRGRQTRPTKSKTDFAGTGGVLS
jgi:transcriptional regulator with XRE-family HTH domain